MTRPDIYRVAQRVQESRMTPIVAQSRMHKEHSELGTKDRIPLRRPISDDNAEVWAKYCPTGLQLHEDHRMATRKYGLGHGATTIRLEHSLLWIYLRPFTTQQCMSHRAQSHKFLLDRHNAFFIPECCLDVIGFPRRRGMLFHRFNCSPL